MIRRLPFAVLGCLALGGILAGRAAPDGAREALHELAAWRQSATQTVAQYEYTMSARVCLLLIWVGKDDVGGGFIRFRSSQHDSGEESKSIEILFGSDPERVPRRINRWGAATEVVRRRFGSNDVKESSLFFGLMKTSRGDSTEDMQKELSSEATSGKHAFVAGLSLLGAQQSMFLKTTFITQEDLDFREATRAEEIALNRLQSADASVQILRPNGPTVCSRSRGFLFTVHELVEAGLSGAATPRSLCFSHDSRPFLLTLERVKPIRQKTVRGAATNSRKGEETIFSDLAEIHFTIRDVTRGKRTSFKMWIGTTGHLRAVPVVISYRPKWWFEVNLHLRPDSPVSDSRGAVAR